jgi:hypothetical protein
VIKLTYWDVSETYRDVLETYQSVSKMYRKVPGRIGAYRIPNPLVKVNKIIQYATLHIGYAPAMYQTHIHIGRVSDTYSVS